jgi:integrase
MMSFPTRCDIRRSVTSYKLGVDLPTVQRISGHKTLAMVTRYAHQNGSHIQVAMDKAGGTVHDEDRRIERSPMILLGGLP